MAYYYPAQTREPRMNNNGSVHLSQVPDGGQRSLGSDWSGSAHTYPAHTTEGQDDPKKREKLQQYTYIPSTSTFSPHQRPPSVIPSFTPYISSYGPQPPHPTQATVQPPHSYPAGYTPHIIPAPPIPPIPPSQYHGPSAPGSLGDPAPPVLYLSVDPFRGHKKTKEAKTSLPMAYDDYKEYPPSEVPDYVVYPYAHRRTVILALLIDFLNSMFGFFFDSLPRQIYLLFLLYLPSFYFSRVARIFEEAEMTMPEIENMALQVMGSLTIQELQWSSPASANLKATWEGFIDSLLREWKTLNIVSVLLLSAILTILQIEAASTDPIARNCALISLICALMSLLYGCMYIIRFASMRKTYKALEWAKMAQKTSTVIWWNVWVLLALPATWLAWSIILYIACIMAFVWRTGAGGLESQLNLSARAELAVRIVISAILGLGVLYFALILNTLRRYGDSMDKQFKRDLELMTKAKRQRSHAYGPGYSNPQYYSNMTAGGPHAMGNYPTHKWFRPAKAIDFRFHVRSSKQMPDYLLDRSFTQEKWEKFISEAYNAWNGLTTGPFSVGDSGASTSRPQDVVARLLEKWNQKYFQPRSTLGILCHEYIDLFPDSPVFAIYIIDATLVDGQLLPLSIAERFGPVPEGLSRIDIFDRPAHDKQVTRRILGRTSIFSSRNPLDGRVRFPDQETIRSPSELYNMHDNSYLTTQPPHLPQPIRPPIFVPPLRQPRSKSPEIEPSPSNSIDESGKFRPRSRSRSTLSESPSRDRDSLSRTEPARRHTRRRRSASMSTFEHLSGLPPVTPTITPQFMGPRSDFDVPPPTDNKGGWMFVPPGWQGNVYPTRTDIGALTPNTFPTVTPSAISNLDILVPPSMQNQRWAPYQRPPHPVQPIQGYNQPWPNLAEMLSDNDPQQSAAAAAAPPMSVDRARRRRRHRSREQQLPAESNADLPTVANPDPPESLPDVPGDPVDRNPRRRSTSTSYRSFSHSPPRGLSDPSLDPLGSSPNAGHLEGDEQGVGGTSSHIPLHRGRDVTPRAERAPVDHHQEPMGAEAGGGLPGTSTSTSSTPGQAPQEPDPIVNEPWTRYYHYLRTTYNVA